jgi:steroid 5-alpha reductase family enzyme
MIETIFILFILYAILFILSIKLQDNSIADIFWWLGFIVIATMSYYFSESKSLIQGITTLLIMIWWIRLISYIGRKKCSHSWEDARYARWRKEWKYFYLRSFFQVYMLQGVLMLVVAAPIFLINLYTSAFQNYIISFLWLGIALIWFFYEVRADNELSLFKKTKKPWEILITWLRKYSRYPQYFWESMFWFGICVIASQISLWAFIGWVTITFLLRYVSWVPMLEKRYKWNTTYKVYSKKTPIFIPNFFI